MEQVDSRILTWSPNLKNTLGSPREVHVGSLGMLGLKLRDEVWRFGVRSFRRAWEHVAVIYPGCSGFRALALQHEGTASIWRLMMPLTANKNPEPKTLKPTP